MDEENHLLTPDEARSSTGQMMVNIGYCIWWFFNTLCLMCG